MTTLDNASSDRPFKDHFSGHSSSYAAYRPAYPDALFSFLADCCSRRKLAWDCATGNGQAARALVPYFEQVVASDASDAQIQAADTHPTIEFRIARAEASGLDDNTIDLITVAQAAHWFDIPGFLDETHRVLVPGGVLAIWSYATCLVNPECNEVINELYADIVHSYWPPERTLVEEGYRGIELPMPMISPPEFAMKIDWSIEEMLGYLRTWSASQRYLKDRGSDPVALIEDRLRAVWREGSREVTWPLNIKIGQV
jgi:SAM-dependent methyltransferase